MQRPLASFALFVIVVVSLPAACVAGRGNPCRRAAIHVGGIVYKCEGEAIRYRDGEFTYNDRADRPGFDGKEGYIVSLDDQNGATFVLAYDKTPSDPSPGTPGRGIGEAACAFDVTDRYGNAVCGETEDASIMKLRFEKITMVDGSCVANKLKLTELESATADPDRFGYPHVYSFECNRVER